MKRIILLYIFTLPFGLAFGVDYSKIDMQSKTVPENLKTIDEISHYLTSNLTSPTDKSRAIFYWISHNISYNSKLINTTPNKFDRNNMLEEVVRTRQGVCQHFAELFNACCQSVGVKSYVISGYTHQGSELDTYSHAWNAVLIDSRYYEIDATWAAAVLENPTANDNQIDQFFMIAPTEFIKTHMPFDPIWQFSSNPITNNEFVQHDYPKLNIKSNFNYYDSINKLPTLSVLDRMIRENNRIAKCGLTNSLVRERADFNTKNINLQKYNLAVDTFNKGVVVYNSYLDARYKDIVNVNLDENKTREMLLYCGEMIKQAEMLLNQINSTTKEVNQMKQNLQTTIKIQKGKIQKEEAYLHEYFKTWKPLRIFVD